MKSRYGTFSVTKIEKEIERGVREEFHRYSDEIYEKIRQDIFEQALAVCFTALEFMGWRKKRLTDFKNQCDEVCHIMFTGIMGREVTTLDVLQHLKDAYGIDFNESNYDYGEGEKDANV